MIGARGRTGEAILVSLLSASHVGHVHVVTSAALPSSEGKLSFVEHTRIAEIARNGIDCAVVLLGKPDGTVLPASFYGRDKVFADIEEEQLLEICRELYAKGVRRLVLIAPTPAHLQSGLLDTMVAGDIELQLVRWFDSLTVIRPGQSRRQPASASLVERIVSGFFSQLAMMLPAHRLQSNPKRVGFLVGESVKAAHAGVCVVDSSAAAARDLL